MNRQTYSSSRASCIGYLIFQEGDRQLFIYLPLTSFCLVANLLLDEVGSLFDYLLIIAHWECYQWTAPWYLLHNVNNSFLFYQRWTVSLYQLQSNDRITIFSLNVQGYFLQGRF